MLFRSGPDRVLFWARLPMLLVATGLAIVMFVWGRELIGGAAAVGALFLYAFDPIVLAHSGLVTTDVGMAAFSMLFFLALWRYARGPSRARLVVAGLTLGLALGTKFSAVMLLPVGGLLLAGASLWPSETSVPRPGRELRPRDPCSCGSGRRYRNCHGAPGRLRGPQPLGRRIQIGRAHV